MFIDHANEVAAALRARVESELKDVLAAHGPGWSIEETLKRCRWIRTAGSHVEVLEIDGKPVLEVHPIQFREEQQHDRFVITCTQRVRRLPPAEGAAG